MKGSFCAVFLALTFLSACNLSRGQVGEGFQSTPATGQPGKPFPTPTPTIPSPTPTPLPTSTPADTPTPAPTEVFWQTASVPNWISLSYPEGWYPLTDNRSGFVGFSSHDLGELPEDALPAGAAAIAVFDAPYPASGPLAALSGYGMWLRDDRYQVRTGATSMTLNGYPAARITYIWELRDNQTAVADVTLIQRPDGGFVEMWAITRDSDAADFTTVFHHISDSLILLPPRTAPPIQSRASVPPDYLRKAAGDLGLNLAHPPSWQSFSDSGYYIVQPPGSANAYLFMLPLPACACNFSSADELLDWAHQEILLPWEVNAVRVSPITTSYEDGQMWARAYYQAKVEGEFALQLIGVVQKGPVSFLTIANLTDFNFQGPIEQVMNSLDVDLSIPQPTDSGADWSPDGRQLVFSSGRNGGPQLFIIDADGSNLTQLTFDPTKTAGQPDWSPDGRRIAYTVFGPGQSGIAVLDLASGEHTLLLDDPGRSDRYPDWSPDGRQLLFTRYQDPNPHTIPPEGALWVLDLDASGGPAARSLDTPGFAGVWSPDGLQIAYIAAPFGPPDLYVMDATGDNRRPLTEDPAVEEDPAWSPDGQQIAFARTYGQSNQEIMIINVDGTNPQRLTDQTGNDNAPTWSPDGQTIAFDSAQAGQPLLYQIPAAGGTAALLSPPFSFTYVENFDASSHWAVGQNSDAEGSIENGVYRLTVHVAGNLFWSMGGEDFGDGLYEVEATLNDGPLDNGFGLLFRFDHTTESFYLFAISGDGEVWIGACTEGCNGEVIPLVGDDWFESPAVIQGINQTNHLQVRAEGSNLTFFINGQQVAQISDSRFASGDIGIFVQTLGKGGVSVVFDNFKVSSLDER